MKVSAAVRELEQEYGEQATFVLVSPEETGARADELTEYGFTDLKHGLVVFNAAGDAVAKIPGHNFGRTEIEAALKTALDG